MDNHANVLEHSIIDCEVAFMREVTRMNRAWDITEEGQDLVELEQSVAEEG